MKIDFYRKHLVFGVVFFAAYFNAAFADNVKHFIPKFQAYQIQLEGLVESWETTGNDSDAQAVFAEQNKAIILKLSKSLMKTVKSADQYIDLETEYFKLKKSQFKTKKKAYRCVYIPVVGTASWGCAFWNGAWNWVYESVCCDSCGQGDATVCCLLGTAGVYPVAVGIGTIVAEVTQRVGRIVCYPCGFSCKREQGREFHGSDLGVYLKGMLSVVNIAITEMQRLENKRADSSADYVAVQTPTAPPVYPMGNATNLL